MLDEALATQLERERDRVAVELAGAVAHNLKQPLAVAWGYLELLLDDRQAAVTPTMSLYLREIQAALQTMDGLINKLQSLDSSATRAYPGNLRILDLD